jgi:arginase family enzyme
MEAERAVRGLNTDGTFAPHAVGGGSSTKVFDGTDRLLAERNASSYNAGLSQWPTILLGNLLALRRRGRYGLLFLDGHADFYQPAAEPNGEAASMDLALATGRGPAVVTDIEGRCPLVRDEHLVVFGRRDAADAEAHGSQRIEDTAIAVTDLAAVRAAEIEAAAASAVERLSKSELDGV